MIPRMTTESFIEKARIVHGDKYDYSESVYPKNNHMKIKILCKIHGMFEQTVTNHLRNHGCKQCHDFIKTGKVEDFLTMAKKTHGETYDYSKVEYKARHIPVIIICKKHGEFSQRPGNHINGACCPKCQSSHGEIKVRNYLESRGIEYEQEKTFQDLKIKKKLRFDFFIPSQNILIEFDGICHYPEEREANPRYKYKLDYGKLLERDRIKNEFCIANRIPLIRIKYNENIANKLDQLLFL